MYPVGKDFSPFKCANFFESVELQNRDLRNKTIHKKLVAAISSDIKKITDSTDSMEYYLNS